jgi:WD40 repeat protein
MNIIERGSMNFFMAMDNYGQVSLPCPDTNSRDNSVKASADETVQVVLDKSMPMDDCSNPTTKPFKPLTHPVAVRAILPLNLTNLSEPYLLTAAGDVLRIYDISTLDEPEYISEVDAHWHDITAVRLWMRKIFGDDGKARVEPWIITTSLDRTIRKWKLTGL